MQRLGLYFALFLFSSVSCQSVKKPDQEATLKSSEAQIPSVHEPRSAIVQPFNWTFSDIKQELCYLRSIGVSHVHVSPAQKSNPAADWWARYQPDDLREIDGPLGDLGDYQAMIAEADRCGITIIADIVINHMANYNWDENQLYYPRGCDQTRPYSFDDPKSCLYRPENFHKEECIHDYGDHAAVMVGRICGGPPDRGIPDLRTGDVDEPQGDPHVLSVVQSYLKMLYRLGVRGFRLDAAKHMHPDFIARAISILPQDAWVYGEIITDRREGFGPYYNIEALDLMDFPLTRSMIEAFGYGGSLDSLTYAENRGRALPYDKAITFVTNHDVWGNESGLGYRYEGSDAPRDELLAHIFLLGRGLGTPYIYSEGSDGPSLNYRSKKQSFVNYHHKFAIERMLLFHNQAGNNSPTWRFQDQNHLAWSRGDKTFVAINKSSDDWNLDQEVDLGLADGLYIDLLDQGNPEPIEIRDGHANLTIPARYAIALVLADE